MDVNESAVLQGMETSRRQSNMHRIVDDEGDVPGLERQYVDQLFAVETQRAYVNELKLVLKTNIEDIDDETKASLKKTLSSNIGTLVLMEVRFKALESTLSDIQARIKQIETAGTVA